ncbi:hypothetical protein ACFQ6Q_35055 [Streptomyces sp. NPDC056437]|uniref:hypothetical protein n=1 Tax=Streptomyces sp. NPDC056437 TaxID=3345816 RepID=UPI0036930D7A
MHQAVPDRRWAEDGIRGYAVHPGIVAGTNLNSSVGEEQLKATGLMDEHGQPVVDLERGIKTVQQGAGTTAFAATSAGGDRRRLPLTGAEKAPPADVVPYAIDPQSARRLWELSEELIKG